MHDSVAWLHMTWLLGHVNIIEVYTLEQPTCCLPIETNERLATRLERRVF